MLTKTIRRSNVQSALNGGKVNPRIGLIIRYVFQGIVAHSVVVLCDGFSPNGQMDRPNLCPHVAPPWLEIRLWDSHGRNYHTIPTTLHLLAN